MSKKRKPKNKKPISKIRKESVDIFTGQLMDELKQTLDVPTEKKADFKRDPNSIVLDETVEEQLRDYCDCNILHVPRQRLS